VFFFAALSLIPLGIVKVDFMGNSDSNNVWINVKYAPGISIEDNQKYSSQLANEILSYIDSKYPQIIKDISLDLGSQNGASIIAAGGDGGNNNLAAFNIRLIEGENRTIKSYQMVEDLQQFFSSGIKKKYSFIQEISPLTQKAGPPSGKAIGFYIEGKDYTQINQYIQTILPSIKKIPGVYNANASIEYTNGKIKYVLDENLLKSLGITNMSAILAMVSVQNSNYEPNGIKIKDFNDFGDDPLPLVAFLQTK
jgi:multidrug efflux pump subunit AcrB